MYECQFVQLDIVWNETKHVVYGTIKHLVAAEITAKRTKNKVYQCSICY